ncbi:MAG: hypothetical protein ACXW5U_30815 [Thermoanaerobaculia bacterium]
MKHIGHSGLRPSGLHPSGLHPSGPAFILLAFILPARPSSFILHPSSFRERK